MSCYLVFNRFLLPVMFTVLLLNMRAVSGSEKIILAYVEMPPYTFTADDGKPDGVFLHLAMQTLWLSEIAFETRVLPAKRLYYELAKGNVDLFLGITTSPIIKGKFLASQAKIGNITLNMYYLGSKKQHIGKESLIDSRVGLLNGYSYGAIGELVTQHSNDVTYLNNHKSGFLMLNKGRLDFFLDYEGPGQAAINELNIDDIKQHTLFSLAVYFVFSKKNANARQLIEKIDKNFNRLFLSPIRQDL